MSSFDISSALGALANGNQTGAVQASDSSTSVRDLSEHQTGQRAQPTKSGGGMSSVLSDKGILFDAVLILVVSVILLWVLGAGVFRKANLG